MTAKSQVVGHAKDMCGLTRPRFGPGQLLRDDDLRQGVEYTRDLSRLLFRSFFGCGVVCGLEVKATFACGVLTVEVQQGLALDCKGDPVHVCAKKSVVVDPRCTNVALNPPLWVVLRGTAKSCAPRAAAACDAGDGEPSAQCTRETDGFEIQVLTEPSGCECGCPDGTNQWHKDDCQCADPQAKCYEGHYGGKCGCSCGDCFNCDCDWLILAKLYIDASNVWMTDYSYRRFIRPVLIADPLMKPAQAPKEAIDYETLLAEREAQFEQFAAAKNAALHSAEEQFEAVRRDAELAVQRAREAEEREAQARKEFADFKAALEDKKKDGKKGA